MRSLGTQPTHLSEIRLVIADERKLLRQGLIALFTTELGILVVGEAADGAALIDLVTKRTADVVLLNSELPHLDGAGVAARLRKLALPPELVFMTRRHNERQMREAFALGARAYLLTSCDFKELVLAVRKAAVGDYYVTGAAGHDLILRYINSGEAEDDSARDGLTSREREMCRLLADGLSTKEAAEYLAISVKTAETHRARIMKKLRARNVTDVVKYCIRNGIAEP